MFTSPWDIFLSPAFFIVLRIFYKLRQHCWRTDAYNLHSMILVWDACRPLTFDLPLSYQVQDINNEAAELSQNATAQSDLIRARAEAEAQAIIESAHSSGLAYMYETLNITSEEQKASLNYLRTLRDHQHVHMSVNFESLVNAAGFRPAN